MQVNSLKVKNFRNIKDSVLVFSPKINLILGSNGQGKTSFLEALGFISALRSFRNTKTIGLIQRGELEANIECILKSGTETNSGPWQTSLNVHLKTTHLEKQRATKTAYVNHKLIHSTTQYLSQRFGNFELGFHAVVFNPSDHELVSGDPSVRRTYLDQVLAAEDIQYLTILKKYKTLLEQRNAILKEPGRFSDAVLAGYNAPYCEYGAWITYRRLKWIERLKTRLKSVMVQIAPSQSELQVVYVSQWAPIASELSINNKELRLVEFSGHEEQPSLKLLEHSFQERLIEVSNAEKKCGYSLVGPHRDDWVFYLGGYPFRGFGSQGESRSALLALKLAELEMFRKETGHRPILLLDDFSSELDRDRRLFLMQFLQKTDLQTFITTTEFMGFPELDHSNFFTFLIQNGAVTEKSGTSLSG